MTRSGRSQASLGTAVAPHQQGGRLDGGWAPERRRSTAASGQVGRVSDDFARALVSCRLA